MLNINFRNYEILKTISDQLRLLAWAVGAIFGYMAGNLGLVTAVLYTITHWPVLQFYAIYTLNVAQKYKKE
jgi:hypothetical protein